MSTPVVSCINLHPLDELPSLPVEDRDPCSVCGSLNRHVAVACSDSARAFDQLRLKQRRPGYKRPIKEIVSGHELHRDSGEVRHVSRVIDKLADSYDEVIKRPTGDVAREVHEPLSVHRNRKLQRPTP